MPSGPVLLLLASAVGSGLLLAWMLIADIRQLALHKVDTDGVQMLVETEQQIRPLERSVHLLETETSQLTEQVEALSLTMGARD